MAKLPMSLKTQKSVGLIIGLTVTGIVLAMTIYMIVGPQRVPVESDWAEPPVLYVCDTAPGFAQPDHKAFKQAVKYWTDRGWSPSAIDSGPCTKLCEGPDDVQVPCMPGAITVDILSGTYWTEEHIGVCVRSRQTGTIPKDGWAYIGIPPYFEPSIDWEGGETLFLPKDAEAYVVAHEIGHCLAGLGHASGAPMGCMAMETVPGHMMHENAYHAGWTDQSIPKGPGETR